MMMRVLLIPVVVMTITSCAPEDKAAPVAAESAAASAADSAPADEVAAPELSGTAWRLLNVAGMDDSTEVPDDPSKYTLVFGPDGTASMRADCNRGMGSWTSGSPGQLQFGPIAATRAMCPPESLSDTYLAQFEWVRSYVLKDGHLFLATMADGAIIEFEPLPAAEDEVGDEVEDGGAGAE